MCKLESSQTHRQISVRCTRYMATSIIQLYAKNMNKIRIYTKATVLNLSIEPEGSLKFTDVQAGQSIKAGQRLLHLPFVYPKPGQGSNVPFPSADLSYWPGTAFGCGSPLSSSLLSSSSFVKFLLGAAWSTPPSSAILRLSSSSTSPFMLVAFSVFTAIRSPTSVAIRSPSLKLLSTFSSNRGKQSRWIRNDSDAKNRQANPLTDGVQGKELDT